MAFEQILPVTLAIILGTLIAVVYSLRILVLLERRIARMDHHVELMTMTILKDEKRILDDAQKLEAMLNRVVGAKKSAPKKKPAKSASSKKSASKKSVSKKSTKVASSKKTSTKKAGKKKTKK